ncbi:MAG: hypothetical protein CMM61_16410 [Rhodospirillaceae bacterium]|nr:hypothetical protein [Rhodospirillaceae bacterium]
MPAVELVYDKTCPNIEGARKQLIAAFGAAGRPPTWSEWEVDDPGAPDHVRSYGSPTILVDGEDVSGIPLEETGSCCRIYTLEGDARGVPPLDQIVAALTPSSESDKAAGAFRLNAAMVPSIGAALLPKLACPACWPAYAGLFSSLGIGFIDYTPYLLPLTGAFLAIAVLALAYRARTRRGYLPFGLGLIAAGIVLIGKFGFDSDPVMWAGLGVLVAASLWNTWPMRRSHQSGQEAECPACVGAPG